MADRFPLIVNSVSKKIEELVSGDNLDLTGNGVIVSGDTGAGKYLTSDGTTVFWDSPGDVYLTQTQTVTNKTFEQCTLSGTVNTLTNIPNTALVNSGITVNGITIALGGSVITPDNNTTYAISAQDGASASSKILRLSSGGNAGSGVDGGGNGTTSQGSNGSNGTANRGGGAGGGYDAGSNSTGGSGRVILRYPDSEAAATSTTGIPSPQITVGGGYRTYDFTGSGTITF